MVLRIMVVKRIKGVRLERERMENLSRKTRKKKELMGSKDGGRNG